MKNQPMKKKLLLILNQQRFCQQKLSLNKSRYMYQLQHRLHSLYIIAHAVFSLAIGVVYCTVAGLMALYIVSRKATGAALGMVGLASYAAAGIQNVVSGFMIGAGDFDFRPVSVFWLIASLLSFMIPVLSWRLLKRQSI